MTSTHRGPRPGFDPSHAADAMWEAMEQMRASVEKRVGTRMGRGDVRAAVLALLVEEPMHGYQIIREITQRTDGRWKPSAGSVYPTLQLLADEGAVTAQTRQDRKVYALTEAGREEAEAAASAAPWTERTDHDSPGFGSVSKAGLELAQAVSQVARTGTASQQRDAVEALHETRRRIYSILAQD